MKEEIANKINDIIQHIINKPVRDITYNEYCIIDAKLREMEYKEKQEQNKEDYSMLLGKLMGSSLDNPVPAPLVPEKSRQ